MNIVREYIKQNDYYKRMSNEVINEALEEIENYITQRLNIRLIFFYLIKLIKTLFLIKLILSIIFCFFKLFNITALNQFNIVVSLVKN